jgi:phosphoribosylglycinamide formyltransferase 1
MSRLPVVVLISGRGSNLRVLADQAQSGQLPIDILAVMSDRATAPGLQLAAERGIATVALDAKQFADRTAFDAALAKQVAGFAPRLVVLAGYMKILGNDFVRRFSGQLLNIHPSLLPKYKGLHTHRRALAAGEREHGASVHFVSEQLDGGPTVIQGRVPVLPGDTEHSLAARVQQVEHMIYPQAVGWYAQGRLTMRDEQAWLDAKPLTTPISMALPL